MGSFDCLLREIGAVVLERGWLSSNNIVFCDGSSGGATVIDTGYATHAEQTISLLESVFCGERLSRIVNTHLHSDHAGGNAAIQRRWGCEVWVPEASFEAVREWDHDRLTYRATDQRCEAFEPGAAIKAGSSIEIGKRLWWALAAPGHDVEALMYYEPQSGVLISGDALWENRLAINFSEIYGHDGFAAAAQALDCIESLNPRLVIPGHGSPFTDVGRAIASSRLKLATFGGAPERHQQYAARALTMFYMMEHGQAKAGRLQHWLLTTPIFTRIHKNLGGAMGNRADFAAAVVNRLLVDSVLERRGQIITLPQR